MKNGNQNQRKHSIVVRIFAIIGALTIVALSGLFLLVFIIWPKDLMMSQIIESFIETSDYISYCSTSPEKKLSCMNCPACKWNEDAQEKDEWDKCRSGMIYQLDQCTPKPYEEILSEQKGSLSEMIYLHDASDYQRLLWKKLSMNTVPASRFSANDNRAEVFIIENLPLDACVKLATYDWSQINNAAGERPFYYKIYYKFNKVHTQVMAVGVGNMAAEALACGDGCIERSGDGCTGEAGTEPLIGCPNGSVKSLPLSKKDALAACKKNGQIAIKFH